MRVARDTILYQDRSKTQNISPNHWVNPGESLHFTHLVYQDRVVSMLVVGDKGQTPEDVWGEVQDKFPAEHSFMSPALWIEEDAEPESVCDLSSITEEGMEGMASVLHELFFNQPELEEK